MIENTQKLIEPIIPGEEIRIASIEELQEHLKKRESYFLSTLRRVSAQADSFTGLQKINKTEQGHIDKTSAGYRIDESHLHTGKDQCEYATYAIGVAIAQLAQKNNLNVSVKSIKLRTSNNAEDWPTGKFDFPIPHTIGALVNNETQNVEFYYDATYGQIDHRYTGKMLFINPNELDKYYRNPQQKPLSVEETSITGSSTPPERDYSIDNPRVFKTLVETIAPQS